MALRNLGASPIFCKADRGAYLRQFTCKTPIPIVNVLTRPSSSNFALADLPPDHVFLLTLLILFVFLRFSITNAEHIAIHRGNWNQPEPHNRSSIFIYTSTHPTKSVEMPIDLVSRHHIKLSTIQTLPRSDAHLTKLRKIIPQRHSICQLHEL